MALPTRLDTIIVAGIVIRPKIAINRATGEPNIFVEVIDVAAKKVIDVAIFQDQQDYDGFVQRVLAGPQ